METLPIPYIRVENSRQALTWLSAAFYDWPGRKLTVLGVTGTDGKDHHHKSHLSDSTRRGGEGGHGIDCKHGHWPGGAGHGVSCYNAGRP